MILDIKYSPEKFESNKDAKCLIHCIFETIKLFNGNKVDATGALEFAKDAPIEYREYFQTSINKCKTAADGIEDKCEAAFLVHKCFGPPLFLKGSVKKN